MEKNIAKNDGNIMKVGKVRKLQYKILYWDWNYIPSSHWYFWDLGRISECHLVSIVVNLLVKAGLYLIWELV